MRKKTFRKPQATKLPPKMILTLVLACFSIISVIGMQLYNRFTTNSNAQTSTTLSCDFTQIKYKDIGGVGPCYKTASFTCPDGRVFNNQRGPKEEGSCPTKARWQEIYKQKCGCTEAQPPIGDNRMTPPPGVIIPTVGKMCEGRINQEECDDTLCVFLKCANNGEGLCLDKPVYPAPTINPAHYCIAGECPNTQDPVECRRISPCDMVTCPGTRQQVKVCTKDPVAIACARLTQTP